MEPPAEEDALLTYWAIWIIFFIFYFLNYFNKFLYKKRSIFWFKSYKNIGAAGRQSIFSKIIVRWSWNCIGSIDSSFISELEKVNWLTCPLKLTEEVPQLFRAYPKLTELRMDLLNNSKLKMNDELENEVRAGFQRLKLFELKWSIHSWPKFQKILKFNVDKCWNSEMWIQSS